MKLIHWAKEIPSLTEGHKSTCVFSKEGTKVGTWCVPYGYAYGNPFLWCTGEHRSFTYRDGRVSPHIPARWLGIVFEIPDEEFILRGSIVRQGKIDPIPLDEEGNIKEARLVAMCLDDDNGIIVDMIRSNEVIDLIIGIWVNDKRESFSLRG